MTNNVSLIPDSSHVGNGSNRDQVLEDFDDTPNLMKPEVSFSPKLNGG